MNLLDLNNDCLGVIGGLLSPSARAMFKLTCKHFFALRITKLSAKKIIYRDGKLQKAPSKDLIIYDAMAIGRLELLVELASLDLKPKLDHVSSFKGNNLGTLKWLIGIITLKDQHKDGMPKILEKVITKTSNRECDLYVLDLLTNFSKERFQDQRLVVRLNLRSQIYLYEKWESAAVELDILFDRAAAIPGSLVISNGIKILQRIINDKRPVRDDFFHKVAVNALNMEKWEMLDVALPLVTDQASLTHELTRRAIDSCNLVGLNYLRNHKVLADRDYIHSQLGTSGFMLGLAKHAARNKSVIEGNKHVYKFVQELLKLKIGLPKDLFTRPQACWKDGVSYAMTIFLVKNGVEPDTSGTIIKRFAKKKEELHKIGFR